MWNPSILVTVPVISFDRSFTHKEIFKMLQYKATLKLLEIFNLPTPHPSGLDTFIIQLKKKIINGQSNAY